MEAPPGFCGGSSAVRDEQHGLSRGSSRILTRSSRNRRSAMRRVWLVILSVALFVHAAVALQQNPGPKPPSCVTAAKDSTLPLPSSIPPEGLADFEKQVLAFLKAGTYKTDLGWCGDKGVRDTG